MLALVWMDQQRQFPELLLHLLYRRVKLQVHALIWIELERPENPGQAMPAS